MPRSLSRHRERKGLFEIFIALVLVRFVLLAMLLVFLAPKTDQNKSEMEERNIIRIELTWEDNKNVDVDLWVQAPNDRPVGWSNKGGKYIDLVRDDLGNVRGPHYEIAYGRQIIAGEYVVNSHLYANREPGYNIVPINLVIFVGNTNDKSGKMNKFHNSEAKLLKVGEEITMVRFTMNGAGQMIGSPSTVFKKLYGT